MLLPQRRNTVTFMTHVMEDTLTVCQHLQDSENVVVMAVKAGVLLMVMKTVFVRLVLLMETLLEIPETCSNQEVTVITNSH